MSEIVSLTDTQKTVLRKMTDGWELILDLGFDKEWKLVKGQESEKVSIGDANTLRLMQIIKEDRRDRYMHFYKLTIGAELLDSD